jgi:hypothetical protein
MSFLQPYFDPRRPPQHTGHLMAALSVSILVLIILIILFEGNPQ